MCIRKHILLFCFLFLAGNSLSAQPDTLSHIGEKPKKGDSIVFVNILRKFNWEVIAKDKDGKPLRYVSRRPDTLDDINSTDTVFLSTSFFVASPLLDEILTVHYELKGSLLMRMNGQTVIATGDFQKDHSNKLSHRILNDFTDFIFKDSFQKVSVTYLPYPKTNVFDLSLKIDPLTVAEKGRHDTIKDDNESYGMGFYYLAFGIVFMSLFVFFREKTEYLYFSLFCVFGALSFISDALQTELFYHIDSFFGILSFEFLSIFFCKILMGKEKSKRPLMIIVVVAAISFLPFIRYNYTALVNLRIPVILAVIISVLYCYTCISAFVFLVKGIGKKQWEAKVILTICFIPIVVFALLIICLVVVSMNTGSNGDYNKLFSRLFGYLTTSIIYIYPLAAVYILGRRNGIAQKQLQAQVLSIQQLSEENLAKEKEKQHILEHQKESLEHEVTLRTAEIVTQKEEIEKQHGELVIEKRKSDDLLRNILPEEVAEELKEKGFSEARLFDNVTVLFTDFVNFTNAGERMRPQELVDELHTCFKAFDEMAGKYNIEKIKTIGDAYLAVCGLPAADPGHAENIVRAAGEIVTFMQERRARLGDKTFDIRIGVHSGSVVAGIVGVKKFAYDVWGDTVNTAARMEQSSEAGKINISQTTYELIKDTYNCVYRGEIEAKHKGILKMYFVS